MAFLDWPFIVAEFQLNIDAGTMIESTHLRAANWLIQV